MKILLVAVKENLDFWIFIELSQSFAFFVFFCTVKNGRARSNRPRSKIEILHDSLYDNHRENHFLKFWWRLYDSVKSYPCYFDLPKITVQFIHLFLSQAA